MKSISIFLRYLSLLSLLILPFYINAQDWEAYKKQQKAKEAQFARQYESKLQELQQKYDDYVEQQDKAFAEYLKQQWEEFRVFAGEKPPDKPKPEQQPEFALNKVSPDSDEADREQTGKKEEQTKLKKLEAVCVKPYESAEQFIPPLIQESYPQTYNYSQKKINFYSADINFSYDPEIPSYQSTGISNQGISDWWQNAGKANYTPTVNDLLNAKDRYALNDWAYFLLLNKVSNDIFPADKNSANLLHWFLLVKSGFNAKIGFYKDKTTVLFPSEQELYGVNFMNSNGRKFYMQEYLGDPLINTYEGNYPGSDKKIDFNIYRPLNLSSNEKTKTLKLTYGDTAYKFTLSYNPDLVNFYNDYPVTDLRVYFDAAFSAQAKETLAEQLAPVIKGKNEEEAAGFLLHFTQNAFKYKVDEEQFGKERFLFPEEVLHYPFSDCEDRSALYASLVKDFLNLDVIGLEYPWHIATAVRFKDKVDGDYVLYNGKQYTIADPTYINAPVGRAMPRYKNQEAKIIDLNAWNNRMALANRYWKAAEKAGACRGGEGRSTVFDEEGACFQTGFLYKRTANENEGNEEVKRQLFVAKYNPAGELIWVRNTSGEGLSTGISIERDENSDLYVMGTYRGTLNYGQFRLPPTTTNDVLLMKLSPQGDIIWVSKAGFEKDEQEMPLKYLLTFNGEGKLISKELFTANPARTTEGIFIEPDGKLRVSGSFNNTTGLQAREFTYAGSETMDYARLLKEKNDEMLQSDVEKTIAGLFAVVDLAKSNGIVIPGSAAQQALDQNNPSFKNTCPDIYEAIGNVSLLKNSDGVVIIRTKKQKPVSIYQMKVYDNAKIKIDTLPSGNEKVVVLSGVDVGKFVVWYNLNHVQMFRDSGDLLFNYSSDNTTKTVNLKKDILEL